MRGWAQRRWLFVSFFKKELTRRYSGTLGGGLWALGQPLLMLAIYSFVFGMIFRARFPELEQHSFTAFVASALWPWMAFQEAIQRGAQAIVGNAGLIKKIVFPHQILVLASVAATFATHLLGFTAVWILLIAFGESFSLVGVLLALAAWLALFVLAAALASLAAALQVFLRDIDHLLGPMLMVLFYATPILYPVSQVPVELRDVFALNPFVYVFEPIRAGLLHGTTDGLGVLAVFALAAMALFWIVRGIYRRLAPAFEDFL